MIPTRTEPTPEQRKRWVEMVRERVRFHEDEIRLGPLSGASEGLMSNFREQATEWTALADYLEGL